MVKALIAVVVVAGLIAWAVYALAVHSAAEEQKGWDRRCAAQSAHAVYTGRSHWLCITPDGRVVDNG